MFVKIEIQFNSKKWGGGASHTSRINKHDKLDGLLNSFSWKFILDRVFPFRNSISWLFDYTFLIWWTFSQPHYLSSITNFIINLSTHTECHWQNLHLFWSQFLGDSIVKWLLLTEHNFNFNDLAGGPADWPFMNR